MVNLCCRQLSTRAPIRRDGRRRPLRVAELGVLLGEGLGEGQLRHCSTPGLGSFALQHERPEGAQDFSPGMAGVEYGRETPAKRQATAWRLRGLATGTSMRSDS